MAAKLTALEGYNVDELRELEYPMLKGRFGVAVLHSSLIQCEEEADGVWHQRHDLPRPCGHNTICKVPHRSFLDRHAQEPLR
jgi:hypothetical protein